MRTNRFEVYIYIEETGRRIVTLYHGAAFFIHWKKNDFSLKMWTFAQNTRLYQKKYKKNIFFLATGEWVVYTNTCCDIDSVEA